MKQSQVVLALANVASQGKYNIGIADAQKMTALFQEVAVLINALESLEADMEAAKEESVPQVGGVRDIADAADALAEANMKTTGD